MNTRKIRNEEVHYTDVTLLDDPSGLSFHTTLAFCFVLEVVEIVQLSVLYLSLDRRIADLPTENSGLGIWGPTYQDC